MSTLLKMLTFSSENEHVLAHNLEHKLQIKKNFSAPKIYNAHGDLTKRWYVYFSFRDPQTGKLKRMKNIYGNVNLYKNKEDRLFILSNFRKNLLQLLKEGYNPYMDNTGFFEDKTKVDETVLITPEKSQESTKKPVVIEETIHEATETKMTISEAFSFALELKVNIVAERTIKDYQNRVDNFIKWLEEHHPNIRTIDQLTKKLVLTFLNGVLLRTSARQRNNYRTELGSLMQTLENNDVMTVNFMKKIPVLKSKPERHKTYTFEKQEEIFHYLEGKDPILLLYIKFISYNFLRPIEVCRLKVKDINLTNNTLQFKAKNSPLKTKIIPKMLVDDLPDLSKLDGEHFLFTPTVIGGEWNTKETNRRDNFSKRFKDVVKIPFGLNRDYGLYSFRHTYITRLYRELIKGSSPHAAKSELMLITGHSSMTALEKYLRDIDAQLPEDYSHLLQ